MLSDFSAHRVGTGKIGQNVRFSFGNEGGVGPESMVGKFAFGDPESRLTGVSLSNYLREFRFYQHIEPILDIQAPTLLSADLNLASHDFVWLMQDLIPALRGAVGWL